LFSISLYRSSCSKSLCIATEGKLHSVSSLSSSIALVTVRTKMITWLKTRASSNSLSLRFFSFSASLMKYCFSPCKVSLFSLSMMISNGYWWQSKYYLVHKLMANWTNVLGKCSREHHNLLFSWSLHKDLLYVFTHICKMMNKIIPSC